MTSEKGPSDLDYNPMQDEPGEELAQERGMDDDRSRTNTDHHSPAPSPRKNTNTSTCTTHSYSWRPPTPPPRLTGTEHNPSHLNDEISPTSREGKGWFPSLFRNDEKGVDENGNVNSPDSSSSMAMICDQSLLLTDEQPQNPTLTRSATNGRKDTLTFIKPKRRRMKNNSRITRTISTLLNQDDSSQHASESELMDDNGSSYAMMKSQHGPSSRCIPETLASSDVDFFYNGIEELEAQRRHRINPSSSLHEQDNMYFNHQSRRKFIESHAILNAEMEPLTHDDSSEDSDGLDIDFTTLFTFGCSPNARARQTERELNAMPAIADITKSSLSYISNGRIQMKLPGDNVTLVMDEFLEPGILSSVYNDVESGEQEQDDFNMPLLPQNHGQESNRNCNDEGLQENSENLKSRSRLPELKYVLTVDEALYKSILKEVPDSKMPCGLYFCCHDAVDGSRHVNISVALIILFFVFLLLFIGTCIWPTD